MNKKNLRKLIPKLIRESNRYKHLIYGGLAFFVMLIINIILFNYINNSIAASAISSLTATGAIAASMEFKDKCWEGNFDWLDLLATIIIPVVVIMILIIK